MARLLKDLGSPGRAAVGAALALVAAMLLAAEPVGYGAVSHGDFVPRALYGCLVDACLVGAAACLGFSLAGRRGASPVGETGKLLLAAGLVGFAALACAFAWGVFQLASVGVDGHPVYLFRRVPPFGMVAALLPVGACLALGRRGRFAAYFASALLAVVGVAVYVRFAGVIVPVDPFIMAGDAPRTVPVETAVFASAVFVVPHLSALAVGLAAALLMEESAARERPAAVARDSDGGNRR